MKWAMDVAMENILATAKDITLDITRCNSALRILVNRFLVPIGVKERERANCVVKR